LYNCGSTCEVEPTILAQIGPIQWGVHPNRGVAIWITRDRDNAFPMNVPVALTTQIPNKEYRTAMDRKSVKTRGKRTQNPQNQFEVDHITNDK
jgi:hypothetical protein